MNGLGGLNKSPNGVVLGLVQLKLPLIETAADIARQTARIVEMVGKARRNLLFALMGFGKDGGALFERLGLPAPEAKPKKKGKLA